MSWVDGDTYRLADGGLHVCTASTCDSRFINGDFTETCSITGRCFRQVVTEHPFERAERREVITQVARAPPRKRTRNPFRRNKSHFKEACRVVRLLLFSAVRGEINARKRRTAMARARKRIRRLRKTGPVPEARVHAVLTEEQRRLRTVPEKEEDPGTVERYARRIVDLWVFIGELPYGRRNASHLHFSSHILGVLYTAQYGLRVGDVRVFARDPFLFAMLPPIHDLKEYGVERRLITIGKNHVKRALGEAPAGALVELADGIYNTTQGIVKDDDGRARLPQAPGSH